MNKFINEKKLYKCFCSNCGEKGHIYRSCNMPITSVGIITYYHDSFDNSYRYLLIRRRDSLGFVDFIRGKYNQTNITHVQNLINEMTIEEKARILNDDFSKLWMDLWNNYNEKIDNSSKFKYESLKNSLSENTNLKNLVENSTTKWKEPEWGFPKGRRNQNEKDYNTALREFHEETGISIKKLRVIQNIKPIEECFIGSNFKAYKHKYYLAKLVLDKDERIEDLINRTTYQKSEVSDIGLFTYKEAIQKFRSYNKERVVMLSDIDKLIHTYNFE